MRDELKETIRQANKNHDEAGRYLNERGCHLCEHHIFTNDQRDSRHVGTIGKDFSVSSIHWK